MDGKIGVVMFLYLALVSLLCPHHAVSSLKVNGMLSDQDHSGEEDSGEEDNPEFDDSGEEDNPEFDDSVVEEYPEFDHSGGEDNPEIDHSVVEDYPEFDHSGGEDKPEFDHSGGEDKPEFVHKAFLGKDFDKLPPDELYRLGKIFHQIDEEILADGLVTQEELTIWIQFTKKQSNRVDAGQQFKKYDINKDGSVSWDEYKKGFWNENNNQKEHHAVLLGYDEKRFKLADQEGDMKLNKNEFSAFLYPEDHDHMIADMVRETIEGIDKNNDGLISLQEYLDDLWTGEIGEPDWMKTERKQFSEIRDKNKDGKMDEEEVKEWLVPHDYLASEAKHLISEADVNGDGKLSKAEIMEKYYIFIGSQVTDFGVASRWHDEL